MSAGMASGCSGDPCNRAWVITIVGVFCTALQFVSATWFVRFFETPNFATQIARNFVATGSYQGGQSKLRGLASDPLSSDFRRYHLPGEPLYIASAFCFLPERLHRYIHVPVTVLLIASVTYVAACIGGGTLGLLTGLYASLQPFIVLHGPVWEDTFLAAALVWLVIALLCPRLVDPGRSRPSLVRILALCCLAAAASLTRQESQLALALIAAATFLVPSLRSLRREGVALILGVLMALAGWGARNRIVTQEFTIGSSRDGITLFEWNSPHTAKSLWHGGPEILSFAPEFMKVHWDQTASMSENQVNRYYLRQTTGYLLAHPAEALGTSLLKLSLSLTGVAAHQPAAALRNVTALISNIIVLCLGIRGLYLLKASIGKATSRSLYWLFALTAIPGLLALLVGPVGLRYRIAVDGVLWITGALTIVHWLRGRSLRPASP